MLRAVSWMESLWRGLLQPRSLSDRAWEAAEASCSFSRCVAREERGKHTAQSVATTWQLRDGRTFKVGMCAIKVICIQWGVLFSWPKSFDSNSGSTNVLAEHNAKRHLVLKQSQMIKSTWLPLMKTHSPSANVWHPLAYFELMTSSGASLASELVWQGKTTLHFIVLKKKRKNNARPDYKAMGEGWDPLSIYLSHQFSPTLAASNLLGPDLDLFGEGSGTEQPRWVAF